MKRQDLLTIQTRILDEWIPEDQADEAERNEALKDYQKQYRIIYR